MKRIFTMAAPAVALPTLIATSISTTTCDSCIAPTSFVYSNNTLSATSEPVVPSSSSVEPDTTEYDIYESTETVCRGSVCDLTTNIYSKSTVTTTIGGELTSYVTGILQETSSSVAPWNNDTTLTTTIDNQVTVITTTRESAEPVEVTSYVTEEDVYTSDVVETQVQETVVIVTQCGPDGCSEVQQTTSTTVLSTHPETKTKTTTKAVEATETTTTQLPPQIEDATSYVTEAEPTTENVVDTVSAESVVYTTVCGPTGCIVVEKTSTSVVPETTTTATTTTAPADDVEATSYVTEVNENTVNHVATDVSEQVVVVSQQKPSSEAPVDEVYETNISTTVVVITSCADNKCFETTVTTTSCPEEPQPTTTTVCETCDAVSVPSPEEEPTVVPQPTTEPAPVPSPEPTVAPVPSPEPTVAPVSSAEPTLEPTTEPTTTQRVPTVDAQSAPPSLSIVNVIENNISTQLPPSVVASKSDAPTQGAIPTFDGGARSLTASGVLGVLVGLAMLM
ncbi:hypothetical protein DIURU_004767 [Diutina rugosa]|uniref:Uncharacterized protein n=1 Tax=Diutina rugosa TaxID=5481 RepID=A0A642UF62_DIURU|nr:uncharacterized protein DIURU_004767 [Diutina rugosa]KAA8897914.1 hypothetical protein DIURU_004767 [Diutina rugosa]